MLQPATPTGPLTSDSGHVEAETLRRAATASFIGNFVEWFDYASYGYLATIIATVFFPSGDHATALLQTFAVFAMSFVLRPIGGVIWGTLGDRRGRRWALSWSILIMSGASFCIGLLPTYAAVGAAAPLGLLLLRMTQGFSASGEYAGASAFLAEYAPTSRRGIYTAIVPASTAVGLMAGSLLVAIMTATLTDGQLETWGWRVPFLLAGPLGLVGRYIRVHLEDSPTFREMAERANHHESTPVVEVVRDYWREMLIALGVASLNAVGFYLVLSYMPTYLSEELGVGKTASFLAATGTLFVYIFSIFIMGHFSDSWGRRRMLMAASALFIVLTVPLFHALGVSSLGVIVLIDILFGIMLTINDGTLPTFLAELFPTHVRYTGFAITFNTANALLGGTAPLVATWLIGATGSTAAPAWYLTAWAAIALVAMWRSKETAFARLRED